MEGRDWRLVRGLSSPTPPISHIEEQVLNIHELLHRVLRRLERGLDASVDNEEEEARTHAAVVHVTRRKIGVGRYNHDGTKAQAKTLHVFDCVGDALDDRCISSARLATLVKKFNPRHIQRIDLALRKAVSIIEPRVVSAASWAPGGARSLPTPTRYTHEAKISKRSR